jgi:hypothetical protein
MQVNDKIGVCEGISLRTYYATSSILDGTQTIIKAAATAFSYLVTGLFFGQSKVLNQWSAAHVKDLKVTARSTWLAVKGVIFPKSSTDLRDALDDQGVHGLGHFQYKNVSKMNEFEKVGVRLQFVVNIVKELFNIVISSMRYGFASLFKKIHPSSQSFKRITFHEFLLLSSHTPYFLGSLDGVARPQTANLKMVRA